LAGPKIHGQLTVFRWNTLDTTKKIFVVSFYKGDLSWVPTISDGHYHIYAKNKIDELSIDPKKTTMVENVGYNIYPYLKYIVDNYDTIADVVVFCKNDVFPRHVSRTTFERLASRKVFSGIEEPSRWNNRYPYSMLSSDNGFLEINNSWYTKFNPRKYFYSFDDFYSFIFRGASRPRYLRFAPGANYVVPKQNILLRSRNFYCNLMKFCEHHQFSGESHMIERALYAIWSSTAEESAAMSVLITDDTLAEMNAKMREQKSSPNKAFLRRLAQRIKTELIRLIDIFLPFKY
jgi:hypothetical protein